MKPLNKIFAGIMCGVLGLNSAMAADNCANIAYRNAHPERCKYADAASNDNTWLWLGGGAAVAGGIAALVGMASGGGSGSSSNGNGVSTSSTQYVRTINPTIITRKGIAPDFLGTDLSPITNTRDYKRNASAYDDIQLVYSIARGYTGAGSTIAVFDTEITSQYSHGAAVSQIANGPIAPNAVVHHYAIASDAKTFKSYNQIGAIINDATHANIHNNSWNVSSVSADMISSRTQFAAQTSQTFVNALSNAAQNDAVLVWAAGNDGNSQSGMLSAAPRVIPELNGHFVNVVAWDSDTRALAEYSNACGITKDYCITAPGAIQTSNGYTHVGTSFAAPVVSAAIAVIREAWPYLNATQITDILFETAADLGDAGVDEIYGHGMLDLENATRPVGELSIAVGDNMTQPLQTAQVPANIAHKIESANPTMAFFDAYGRAYETRVADNISARNRGLGFERLRGDDARMKINMGSLEMGFYHSDMLNATGFLQTDEDTTVSYVALNHSFNLGNFELFTRSQFGTTHPIASSESIVSEYSNLYTASAMVWLRGDKWSFSVGVPETIVRGDMNLHTAIGRRNDGAIIYHDYKIGMATTPSIEYTANYGFLTAGFVDNPYGDDEFYVFAKTKLSF